MSEMMTGPMSGPRILSRRADRGSIAKELTPEQRDQKRRVRRAAARLFAEYGAAAIGRRRVAAVAGQDRGLVGKYYPEDADMLMDVLTEHVWALNAVVCRVFDEAAAVGPFERLEAVIRAWLDHVAAESAEHRCLLFCVRLLPEAMRQQVMLKYRIILDTVLEALGAVVPGLVQREGAMESLGGTARALLSDVGWWPEGLAVAERARMARRIAGMLLAAGRAELAGEWAVGCPAAGVMDGRVYLLESNVARTRFRELLDAVEAGAEVVLTRRGKKVVKMVGVA